MKKTFTEFIALRCGSKRLYLCGLTIRIIYITTFSVPLCAKLISLIRLTCGVFYLNSCP
jgi:hypothetical protein